jgi:hypothetical protein
MSNPVNNSEKKIAEHRLGTILVQAQGLAKLATILKKKNVATIKVSQLEEIPSNYDKRDQKLPSNSCPRVFHTRKCALLLCLGSDFRLL